MCELLCLECPLQQVGHVGMTSATVRAIFFRSHQRLQTRLSNSGVATVGGTGVLGKCHTIGLKAIYTVPNTGIGRHSFNAGIDFKDTEQTFSLNGQGDKVATQICTDR